MIVKTIWILLGYLFGSLPTGYVVVRTIRHTDIRDFGSGNIGATNVGRLMGRPWAVGVTVVDMLKGGVIVLLAKYFGGADSWVVALTALAAVCGHNYPVWLSFRGGKGVATTYGTIFFVAMPASCISALAAGIVWYVVMKLTRYVSVASIISLFTVPLFLFLLKTDIAYVCLGIILGCLATWRHRVNLRRISEGTETKVGRS